MDKTKQIEIQQKINSKIEKNIEDGILAIRENGNNELLASLYTIYDQSSSTIQIKIASVFNDLKDQKSVSIIVELLKKSTSIESKMMLLTSCWQSRLDYIDHLELFIDMIMTEAFEASFESFTIIENLQSKISKERKEELIRYVKFNIAKSKESNLVLSHDVVGIIERYEEL